MLLHLTPANTNSDDDGDKEVNSNLPQNELTERTRTDTVKCKTTAAAAVNEMGMGRKGTEGLNETFIAQGISAFAFGGSQN